MTPAPDSPGGLGGIPEIDQRTPGRDLKLIRTAVRNRWIVPEDGFESLPKAMLGIALDEQRDDRARVGAAKVLTTMHGQNEEQDAPAGPGVQVNTQINVAVGTTAQELLNDPRYLDYCRSGAIEADAGPVCQNGNGHAPPAVEDVPAPGLRRPGTNGHHNGTNGTDPHH